MESNGTLTRLFNGSVVLPDLRHYHHQKIFLMNGWLFSLDTGHYYDNTGNISVNNKSEAVCLEPLAYHHPNGIGCCCSICHHVC